MDTIETIKGSVVQHGTHNDRVYLMRFNTQDSLELITILDNMAVAKGYGKIFAKIPAPAWNAFKTAGYVKEAVVPGLFGGKVDGFFVGKFFSDTRQAAPNTEKRPRMLRQGIKRFPNENNCIGQAMPSVAACQVSDAEEMGAVYGRVFESYPFPIQKPVYLKRMMREGVLYFNIRVNGRIAAIAAAEIDLAGNNTEMTDFATLPQWRGKGFAGALLNHMNQKTHEMGIKTAYTIARAASNKMNAVFKNSGYNYAGRLINNSQICGGIESMTVWYRHL